MQCLLHSDAHKFISWRSKGLTPNQAFQAVQEQWFLSEIVTTFGVDLGLLHITLHDKGKAKTPKAVMTSLKWKNR